MIVSAENIDKSCFHPALKDVEDIFWFFLLSNLALMNFNVQEILKKNEDPTIPAMLARYNKWTNLDIKIEGERTKSLANIKNGQVAIGKVMAIMTCDYLDYSSYSSEINRLEEFKFLRFVRNGAAHGNRFNLKDEKGEWKLEEEESVVWLGKKITRESQGQTVFNDFLFFRDIFLLANHFSEKLKEIDKK